MKYFAFIYKKLKQHPHPLKTCLQIVHRTLKISLLQNIAMGPGITRGDILYDSIILCIKLVLSRLWNHTIMLESHGRRDPCSHFNIKATWILLSGSLCIQAWHLVIRLIVTLIKTFLCRNRINIHLNIPRQTTQYFNSQISCSSWTRNNQLHISMCVSYIYGQCNMLLKEYILKKKDQVFLVS